MGNARKLSKRRQILPITEGRYFLERGDEIGPGPHPTSRPGRLETTGIRT